MFCCHYLEKVNYFYSVVVEILQSLFQDLFESAYII